MPSSSWSMDILSGQRDYILFVHGFCFFLLALLCLSFRKTQGRTLSWGWMAGFAGFWGGQKWVDLLRESLPGQPVLATLDLYSTLFSAVCLLEFARSAFAAVNNKCPKRWIYLPLLVSLPWLTAQITEQGMMPVRVLGALAGMMVCSLLFHRSIKSEDAGDKHLLPVGVLLAIYMLAAAFFPEPESGPLQQSGPALRVLAVWLVRAILAVCLVLAALRLSYAHSRRRSEVTAQTGRQPVSSWLIASVCLVLTCGWLLTTAVGREEGVHCHDQFLAESSLAVLELDPRDVAQLKGGDSDTANPAFHRLRRELQEFRSGNKDVRFAYIMRLSGDKLMFLVDAEPTTSDDYSAPGDIYEETTQREVDNYRAGRAAVYPPYEDSWGTWVSTQLPIIDPVTHRPIASLGMDIDASVWAARLAASRWLCVGVTLLLCCLVIALFTALKSRHDSYVDASEKQYRTLVDNSPNWISLFDKQGRHLMINPKGLAAVGLSESEVIGGQFQDLWHAKHQPTLNRAVGRVLHGQQCSFEAEYQSPDKRQTIWNVVLTPIKDPDGQGDRFVFVGEDITERKRVEEERLQANMALEIEKERLSITLRSIGDGVIATDLDGKVILLNSVAERLTGWSEAEALGQPLIEVFSISCEDQHCECRNPVEEVLKTKGSVQMSNHTEVVSRDGVVRSISHSAAPICDANREMVGTVLVFRDVTERKEAEESLRKRLKYENMLAHASFLAVTVDDIRDFQQQCLQVMGETIGAARAYLFEYSEETDTVSDTFEWVVEPGMTTKEHLQMIPAGSISWWIETLRGDETINCSDTATIPGETEREILKSIGSKSVLAVPLFVRKEFYGFMGFDEYRGRRDMPEEDVNIVKTLAQIIAGTIERRQADEALREREAQLSTVFESVNEGVVVSGLDGNLLHWNHAAVEMHGFSNMRQCLRHLDELGEIFELSDSNGNFWPVSEWPMSRVLRGECLHDLEVRVRRVNTDWERIFSYSGTLARIAEEQPVLAVLTMRDITKRKQAEEDLRKAHVENEMVLASISSIMIGIDQVGRITQWNSAAEAALGKPASLVLGLTLWNCGVDWADDAVAEALGRCVQDGKPARIDDLSFKRSDGKDGWLGMSVNEILDSSGEHSGFLLLAADTTERKILEAQLAQAQKLESIGQLAAGIAHEINTPTQYVGDNTRFLGDSLGDILDVLRKYREVVDAAKNGEVTGELLAEAESLAEQVDVPYLVEEIPVAIKQTLDGVDRVTNIVRAMKEFSHPGLHEKSNEDINKAIETTVTVARNEWKYVADMELVLDPTLPAVPCHATDLNQALLNIIVNAAHAIAEVAGESTHIKGTITIETHKVDECAEIRISDTGPGIPEASRSRVFDPFYTTKPVGKGTGQGLAIAHSVIVDKHGGSITFETEMGKGTTFIIRIPIDTQAVKRRAA